MSTGSQFVVLGCGSSDALTHFNNNALLTTPGGNILIDAGHTIKAALQQQGMDFRDIDTIIITHVHGDHVYGLERIAYETRYKFNQRIKLVFHEKIYQQLWDQTLKGSLGIDANGLTSLEDYFDVETVQDHPVMLHGHQFEFFEVPHTPGRPAYGLMLDDKLFFSGDTLAIPEIVSSKQFILGFHDASLLEHNSVHATLQSLIAQYPAEIRQKLYLMSYEDNWADFVGEVEKEFLGFATQGMSVPLDTL